MKFLKYLTYNQESVDLGLYILNAGYNLINPHETYPYPAHPQPYKFNWDTGRKLNEYQLIYIINGKGSFESSSVGKIKLKPGSIIRLFPGEWHRYRPDEKTGWNEYWIGYNGSIANRLLTQSILNLTDPVLYVGFNEKIFNLYQELIEVVKSERFNFQIIASGILLQILGTISEIINEKIYAKNKNEMLIRKARLMLTEDFQAPISPKKIADALNIGYSTFRSLFKGYTGVSPSQYQMQHRIIRAKELLTNPEHEIKEIAYTLGFESASHFTKVFKNKTGITPGKYRVITLVHNVQGFREN